jgi:nicotinate phosphoribosyltransferase
MPRPGLLTDLYELTMAAGYYETGKSAEKATFELTIRRLPKNRNFVIAAGLSQVVDYLLELRFSEDEIRYLRGLPQFERISNGFFESLREFRFTGDLFAVPEGTVLFTGEPVLTLRAPIIEAQIPETYLLSAITFQTLIATKAARMVEAAGGRGVVEFGTRRAHTAEAGVLGARAAYIGGCIGTSNTLAGFRYGIPVMGTAAHSWVMSFPGEMEAFRQLQRVLGPHTAQLVDTYDSLEGTRKAAALGPPLWGIRLDSGDFLTLSREARSILDSAGLREAKIMLSGDLDEYRIRELISAGAPVDAFGVGTQLSTSGDAPNMSTVYKLVELDIGGIKRFTAKLSEEKTTLPGTKQIFRFPGRDVIGRSGECMAGAREALLRPVMLGGRLLEPLPDVEAARNRAARTLQQLPAGLRRIDGTESYPVQHSEELLALAERTRRNLQ